MHTMNDFDVSQHICGKKADRRPTHMLLGPDTTSLIVDQNKGKGSCADEEKLQRVSIIEHLLGERFSDLAGSSPSILTQLQAKSPNLGPRVALRYQPFWVEQAYEY